MPELHRTGPDRRDRRADTTAPPLVVAHDLRVSFPVRRGRRNQRVRAVNGVSFSVAPGRTLALVGESGSGKSTTGRAVLRLVGLDGGRVELQGRDITGLGQRALRPLRRHMQMVFQDPYSSLDPTATIGNILEEPLRTHLDLDRGGRRRRVAELLACVGLSEHHAERYPHEFSGGQRQRIAIARAIAVDPGFVVLDEAVSALDVSTRNQVLGLLAELQRSLGMAYLFISHDLSVVRSMADEVAVLYLGRIVEMGPVEDVYRSPMHPYTRCLLDSVPRPEPRRRRITTALQLQGEIPDPLRPPRGCAFGPRCPEAVDRCHEATPEPVRTAGGTWVACHLRSPDRPATATHGPRSEEP